MAKLLEITGVFLGERARFGDRVIGEIEYRNGNPEGPGTRVTVRGDAPAEDPDHLSPRLTYRFYGAWEVHPKYGRQFAFSTYVRAQPHNRAGVIRYLATTCHGCGLGERTAETLWDKFGSDAVRILRESPEVAAAAVGGQFNSSRAGDSAAALARASALESCTIELIDLLGGRGFPRSTAKKAIQRWGNRAPEIIRKRVYPLMAFRGCGFARCDALYLDLGHAPVTRKRQAYAAWYALARDTEGHTWHPVEAAARGIWARIAGGEIDPQAALKLAKRGRLIATRRDQAGQLWVAESGKARAEEIVAQAVAVAIAEGPGTWPAAAEVQGVDREQPEKLAAATAGRIGIFSGSPGTGKTYSVGCLARLVVERCGADSLRVAAPTGKAAVRVTQAMQDHGLALKASTIHSLLKVAERDEAEGWAFEHNHNNPLPYRYLIVDESSMIDTGLMAALLDARAAGTSVLFVGDPHQLPPVGHGAPLRDLIAAGLPYGELREIRRNSGTIVQACAQIRDGKRFDTDRRIDLEATPARNLKVIDASGPDDQVRAMFRAIEAARADGIDPLWGVQILVPVNAKSKLSRRELNLVLQRELNKSGIKAESNPFRVGDKIVNLKNGFFPLHQPERQPGVATNADGKVFVANGELAEAVAVEDNRTIARLEAPARVILIPRGRTSGDDDHAEEEKTNTGCSWDLGYALSCHKSQGSEFPVVLVMLDEYPGARMVCSREWIYTAVSRAKRLCLMIGKAATAYGFCRRTALDKRKTFLKDRIGEELARLQRPVPIVAEVAP